MFTVVLAVYTVFHWINDVDLRLFRKDASAGFLGRCRVSLVTN